MSKFKEHLNQKLKNVEFKQEYEQQKKLSELAIKIQQVRNKKGLSQAELAKLSGITQQQLSKIEHAVNGNILTYLRVLDALEYDLTIKPQRKFAHI